MPSTTAGGPAAPTFTELWHLYAAAVHRVCLVVLGDPAAAEAAARRALRVSQSAWATDHPEQSHVPMWLLGITCEVASEARRRRRWSRHQARRSSPLDAALVAAEALPERELLAAALRSAAGLGYAEIGCVLGTSPEMARMACTWALRRIRDETRTAAGQQGRSPTAC
jgi:DNA-directed RNA polymerase specialized sigma24 family protein